MIRHLLAAAVLVVVVANDPVLARDDTTGTAPLRVATLVPYAEDALAVVPGRAEVVATTRRSMTSPPPVGRIDLGSPHSPSDEQLALARPGLVIGDRLMHAAMIERLSRTGAEVLLVDSTSVEGTFASLRELGQRVGASTEMERRIAAAEADIAALAMIDPVLTLPLFGTPASFLLITDRTWLGDLLRRLNFTNLAGKQSGKERFPGYVEMSDEVVAGMRPRMVLLVAHGEPAQIRTGFQGRVDAAGPWHAVGESARGGVHVLEADEFTANPGLDLPEVARRLRRLAVTTGNGSS